MIKRIGKKLINLSNKNVLYKKNVFKENKKEEKVTFYIISYKLNVSQLNEITANKTKSQAKIIFTTFIIDFNYRTYVYNRFVNEMAGRPLGLNFVNLRSTYRSTLYRVCRNLYTVPFIFHFRKKIAPIIRSRYFSPFSLYCRSHMKISIVC